MVLISLPRTDTLSLTLPAWFCLRVTRKHITGLGKRWCSFQELHPGYKTMVTFLGIHMRTVQCWSSTWQHWTTTYNVGLSSYVRDENAKQGNIQNMQQWTASANVEDNCDVSVGTTNAAKQSVCSSESVHILKWKHTHSQVKGCTCSSESMHMLKWKHPHAKLKHAHAEVQVYTCSTESVSMLNWRHAHAQVKVCTCSTESVHMLKSKRAQAQV